MKRITIALLGLVVGTTAACRDMGLEGNIPLEEAMEKPPTPLVVAVTSAADAAGDRLVVDGRLWVPSGMPLTMEEADLRAVGSATGRTVYARRWDQSPYDALFIPRPTGGPAAGSGTTGGVRTAGTATSGGGEWIELRPVLGRSGPVPDGGASTAPASPPPAGEHGGH